MPSSSLLLHLPKASLSPPAVQAHPHLRSSLALGQVFSEAEVFCLAHTSLAGAQLSFLRLQPQARNQGCLSDVNDPGLGQQRVSEKPSVNPQLLWEGE